MRKAILSLLILTPLFGLQSCWAVAVGAGAILIQQDMTDPTSYTGVVDIDSRRVWAQSKATLAHMSLDPIEVDEDLYTAEARVDGARVIVTVETQASGKSLVIVKAKKFGMHNGQSADNVFRQILADLDR